MPFVRRTLAVLSLMVLIAVAAFLLLCLQIDRYGRVDLARPADAIVVLGATVLPGGRAGPDLQTRTRHGVDLYRAGLAPNLICTGGVTDDPFSAAAVAGRLAADWGVPPERIFLADGSKNTSEDARQAAQVMAQHGWQSAIVVSHPLHVYRASVFFKQAGVTAYTSPTTTDVDAIAQPWRFYYTAREGVGVLWPYMEAAGFPDRWTTRLQRWVYERRFLR